MGSVWSSPVALELCCGSPHSVVAGILQFIEQRFLGLGSWCVWLASTLWDTVFHFAFVLHFHELGHYAAKFCGKLIVFGSAVFDDIKNHITSVVFESVNIFLYVFFFPLSNDHFFYICWVWAQSLISLCFIGFQESLNPNTWIPTHLFGFCPSLSWPTPPCFRPASPYQVWSRCRKRGERLWMGCSPSSLGWFHHSQAYC